MSRIDVLRPFIEKNLAAFVGREKVMPDASGEYSFPHGSADISVRLLDNPFPMLQLSSVLVSKPKKKARLLEADDCLCGRGRNVLGEDRRAVRGRQAGGVEEILDRERDSARDPLGPGQENAGRRRVTHCRHVSRKCDVWHLVPFPGSTVPPGVRHQE